MSNSFNFYSRYESGHRKEYIEFTQLQLNGVRVNLLKGAFSRKPLFFLMIEELFFIYCVIAFLRSIFRLKTVGLVFRAKECAISNLLKHKVKRNLLSFFKNNKYIHSLSIIPFFVNKEIEKFCDDWIYDFQFSDIDFLYTLTDPIEVENFSHDIINKAGGRIIVSAIGKQDNSKGFDRFIQTYIASSEIQSNYAFVSGGKIAGISEALINEFENSGGIIINRRINDSELVALYEVSDYIWCCYSPSYDQSSGVLGRAIQFRKGVIVRNGSVAESISCNLGAHYFVMPDRRDELINNFNLSDIEGSSEHELFKDNINKLISYLKR